MSEWQEARLGDLVRLQKGVSYQGAYLDKPGPRLLGLGTVVPGGGIDLAAARTYAGPIKDRQYIRPGELLVALTDITQDGRVLGSPAILPVGAEGEFAVTHHVARAEVLDPRVVDVRFVYYLLRSARARAYFSGVATGTTVRAVSTVDAEALMVHIPPLAGQRRIAGMIGALDDKIELNRRMAETLEQVIRASYAEMVERAEGDWPVGSLADVALNPRIQVDPRQLDPSTPYIGLEHMPRGRIVLGEWGRASDAASGKTHFERNDVLFGKLRPYFRKVGLVPTPGICSTDILVIRAKRPEDIGYVLAVTTDPSFINAASASSTGTRMPRTSWSDLARYPLAMPPAATRAAFTARVWPLIQRAWVALAESKELAKVRDALLPRLLSGELEVAA